MDLDLLNNAVARNAKMSRLLLVAYGRMNFIPPSACPRLGADAAVLQRLGRLAARSDFLVGIVSPLSLIQIRSQVHNTRLMCVANHGLEIADAGRNYVHPKAEAERHFLKQATAQLTKNLASHPNCRVENNGLIALVHCGGAARARVRTSALKA
jgi:trehalose-phosphatase